LVKIKYFKTENKSEADLFFIFGILKPKNLDLKRKKRYNKLSDL